MNNSLSINFTFNESQVRTLSEGEVVWFVAKDVATILGHANPETSFLLPFFSGCFTATEG